MAGMSGPPARGRTRGPRTLAVLLVVLVLTVGAGGAMGPDPVPSAPAPGAVGGAAGAVPPTAVAEANDTTVQVGEPVRFNGSKSFDEDGRIETFAWDFDGDNDTDATGATVTHAFETAGNRSVTLTVTDDQGRTDTDTVEVAVEERKLRNESDIGVTKTGPTEATPNGNITYTITVTNHGPDVAEGVKVYDRLSDQVGGDASIVTVRPAKGSVAYKPNGEPVVTIPKLAPGESVTIEVTVRVTNVSDSTTIANRAGVAIEDANGDTIEYDWGDPNHDNDDAFVLTNVTKAADLSVTKTGPPNATENDTITYTITVTNHGPGTATGVLVRDLLRWDITKADVELVRVDPGDGSVEHSDVDPKGTEGQVFVGIERLAPGESVTITVTVRVTGVPGDTVAELRNEAGIAYFDPDGAFVSYPWFDPTRDDDEGGVTTNVTALPEPTPTPSPTPEPAEPETPRGAGSGFLGLGDGAGGGGGSGIWGEVGDIASGFLGVLTELSKSKYLPILGSFVGVAWGIYGWFNWDELDAVGRTGTMSSLFFGGGGLLMSGIGWYLGATALGTLLGVLGSIFGTIAAVIGALLLLYEYWDVITAWLAWAWEGVKDGVSWLWERGKDVVSWGWEKVKDVGGWIRERGEDAVEGGTGLVERGVDWIRSWWE